MKMRTKTNPVRGDARSGEMMGKWNFFTDAHKYVIMLL
jgi:hypothetical protein